MSGVAWRITLAALGVLVVVIALTGAIPIVVWLVGAIAATLIVGYTRGASKFHSYRPRR